MKIKTRINSRVVIYVTTLMITFLSVIFFHNYSTVNPRFNVYPSECRSDIQEYAESLSIFYDSKKSIDDKLKFYSTKHLVPLVLVKRESINRQGTNNFMTSTLTSGPDNILIKKEPLELKDLFKPVFGESLDFILISGAPGSGKSTFSLDLARNWQELTSYSLALLVSLRERRPQKAETIDDLYIEKNHLNMIKIKSCIEKAEGEGILWILDGFDELPKVKQQDEESIYNQLLDKDVLPKSTVIVTSRHSATTNLRGYLERETSKHIEILGFNSTQVKEYVSYAFKGKPLKMTLKFNDYYSSNPAIMTLMRIPLNAAIITYMYMETFDDSKPVPHTTTELYSQLICVLIRRHQSETNEQYPIPDRIMIESDMQVLPEAVQKNFSYLMKIAYEGVVGDYYIFANMNDTFNHLGLMNNVSSLTGSIQGTYTYNFIHATLQEYLAAMYVSTKGFLLDKESKIMKSAAIPFLFGIASQIDKLNSTVQNYLDYAFHYFDEDIYAYYLYDTIDLVFEYPQFLSTVEVILSSESPSNYFKAGYSIANNNITVNLMVLEYNRNWTDEPFRLLSNGLKMSKNEMIINDKVEHLLMECYLCECSDFLNFRNSVSTIVEERLSTIFKRKTIVIEIHEDQVCQEIYTLLSFEHITFLYSLHSLTPSDELLEVLFEPKSVMTEIFGKHLNIGNISPKIISLISHNQHMQGFCCMNCSLSQDFLNALISVNTTIRKLNFWHSRDIKVEYSEFFDIFFRPSPLKILTFPFEKKDYDFTLLSQNKNLEILEISLRNLTLTKAFSSSVTSKDNSLKQVNILIKHWPAFNQSIDVLTTIIQESTPPLSRMQIELGVFFDFDSGNSEISAVSLVPLMEATLKKSYTFILKISPTLYEKIPDNYKMRNIQKLYSRYFRFANFVFDFCYPESSVSVDEQIYEN